MKAIVYEAPRHFKYKDVADPELESDDVLVKIDACGLCGTVRNRLNELSPTGFDYIVEATGSSAICEETLQFARRGGTVLVYGVYPERDMVRFNPFDLFRREITIKGSFAQIDAFPRALSYLENGKLKVNEIVTDEFALEDWSRVLEHAWARKGIKIAVIPPP